MPPEAGTGPGGVERAAETPGPSVGAAGTPGPSVPVAEMSPASLGAAVESAVERLRASGSETARLDAELLAAHVLGVERTTVIAHPEVSLSPDAVARLEEAVRRRQRGEPVAYIRGMKEFHGLALSADGRALIPRPDTELLADLGVARTVDRVLRAGGCRAVDVGTGSGAVVLAMAATLRARGMLREVALLATDVSADALALARENAVAHGLADAVEFEMADLLERRQAVGAHVPLAGAEAGPPGSGVPAAAAAAPTLSGIDVLLANLPYVPSGDVPRLPIAASFEPRIALDGGPDGLDVVRRLLGLLPGALAGDGVALLEIGAGEAEGVREAVERLLPGWSVEFHRDLAGIERVAEVRPAGDAGASTDAGRPR